MPFVRRRFVMEGLMATLPHSVLNTSCSFVVFVFSFLAASAISVAVAGYERTYAQERVQVTGTVVERETQAPLPSVNITIHDTNIGTTTDSLGRFAFSGLPSGEYIFEARRVGYKNSQHLVKIRDSSMIAWRIEMEQEPVKMEVVGISKSRLEMKKVLERQGKRVILSEDIEKSGISSLSSVLNSYIPGIMSSQMRGRPSARPRFAIYVNGTLVKYFQGELDYIIDVETIDYVEIYRGFGMSPSPDRGSNERIIQIHTKRPGADR
jgi:hypothetical protein